MHVRLLSSVTLAALLLHPAQSLGQVSQDILNSISTPDSAESSIGTLTFTDGAPSDETVRRLCDNLDMIHAIRSFTHTF